MVQQTIKFVLDDKITEIDFRKSSELRPTTTVLNYLRSYPSHKGVKEGCAEGDCGACTIVVAEMNSHGELVYKTLDSCLVFLPMIHGKQLITVENLAKIFKGKQMLHPVQQMLIETSGTQCGYCTPGIIMSLFGLYKNHHQPSREIIEDALTGNLCRCTGYQTILEAAQKACKNQGKDHFSDQEKETLALLSSINKNKETIEIRTPVQTYYKPFSVSEALRLRHEFPEAIVINGSTDVALRQTKKKEILKEILDLSAVGGLKTWKENKSEFVIGAGLSLEQLKHYVAGKLPALHDMLKVFGSLQIRNLATIGGNVGTASPIGDLLPLLFVSKAVVVLRSSSSKRILPIETFITGYRQTDLNHNELITEIRIPKPGPNDLIKSYKVSKRKDLDLSTVSGAFRIILINGLISEIFIAYGGMAAMTKRAVKTEGFLRGKKWSRSNVEKAMPCIEEEFNPISDARSEAEYRKKVGKNLLLKFYVDTTPS